jgi:predicted porin
LEYFEMKKTLVALAALAVVSAASAQSTVTLYGVVDMGIATLKDSVGTGLLNPGAAYDINKTGVQQGTMSNSRFGFKGTEDLGGGLKADFVAEFGFSPDEAGSVANSGAVSFSNRVGTVGLSGNFGALTIGRQYTPYHTVQLAMDLAGNLNATPGYVVNNHNFNGGRASNSVKYASPSFGGFSVLALVGAGPSVNGSETVINGSTPSITQADGKSFGLAGIYAAGPLVAGLAYNDVTNPSSTLAGMGAITGSSSAFLAGFGGTSGLNGAVGANSTEVKVWAAGASYDFTVVKASLAYSALTDTKVTGSDLTSNGYNFSIAAPFGATTLVANLGRATLKKEDAAIDGTITGFQLMANYALSKRTTAYAVAGRDKTSNLRAIDNGDALVRTSTAVGIRHTF